MNVGRPRPGATTHGCRCRPRHRPSSRPLLERVHRRRCGGCSGACRRTARGRRTAQRRWRSPTKTLRSPSCAAGSTKRIGGAAAGGHPGRGRPGALQLDHAQPRASIGPGTADGLLRHPGPGTSLTAAECARMIPPLSAAIIRQAMRWAGDERRLALPARAVLEFMRATPSPPLGAEPTWPPRTR